ncbi:unnamed protein product [Chrysoparadoxa australica]
MADHDGDGVGRAWHTQGPLTAVPESALQWEERNLRQEGMLVKLAQKAASIIESAEPATAPFAGHLCGVLGRGSSGRRDVPLCHGVATCMCVWRLEQGGTYSFREVPLGRLGVFTSGDAYLIHGEYSRAGEDRAPSSLEATTAWWLWLGSGISPDVGRAARFRAKQMVLSLGYQRQVDEVVEGNEPAELLLSFTSLPVPLVMIVLRGSSGKQTRPRRTRPLAQQPPTDQEPMQVPVRVIKICRAPEYWDQGAIKAVEVSPSSLEIQQSISYLMLKRPNNEASSFEVAYCCHCPLETPAMAAALNLLCSESTRTFPASARARQNTLLCCPSATMLRGHIKHIQCANRREMDGAWSDLGWGSVPASPIFVCYCKSDGDGEDSEEEQCLCFGEITEQAEGAVRLEDGEELPQCSVTELPVPLPAVETDEQGQRQRQGMVAEVVPEAAEETPLLAAQQETQDVHTAPPSPDPQQQGRLQRRQWQSQSQSQNQPVKRDWEKHCAPVLERWRRAASGEFARTTVTAASLELDKLRSVGLVKLKLKHGPFR